MRRGRGLEVSFASLSNFLSNLSGILIAGLADTFDFLFDSLDFQTFLS
jgi:hypothetical protein